MNTLINKYIKTGMQQFRLKVWVLSPLAIRNEISLSPLTDYHILDRKIYYLDTDKLLNFIAEKGWLYEFENKVLEFSEDQSGVKETGAIKKNHFIAKFLEERKASIGPFLQDCPRVKCLLKDDRPWVRLQQTVKNEGGAYIPASSIKGAIRTSIMYHWLTQTEDGKTRLADFVENIKADLKAKIAAIDKISYRNYKAKEKGNLTDDQKKELKTQEAENKKTLIARFEEFEAEITTCIFGDMDGKYNAASYLKIADSTIVPYENLIVVPLQKKYRENAETRKKREKKKEFSPSLQELITVGSHFEFKISIPELALDKKILKGIECYNNILNTNRGLLNLFKLVKTFNREYLELEIGRLDGFMEDGKDENKGKAYDDAELWSFHDQLKILKKELLSLKSNESMLCIGFGKSIFLNTTMMAISKLDREVFRNIVKNLYPNHPANKYFPISYYMTSIDQKDYPLGWIKICDENESLYVEKFDLPDYKMESLKNEDEIQGVLTEKGLLPKVNVSLNGTVHSLNTSGLSRYEKMNDIVTEIDKLYTFQIVAIKDNIIKNIKIV